jgi:hypothetical protein
MSEDPRMADIDDGLDELEADIESSFLDIRKRIFNRSESRFSLSWKAAFV